METKKCSECGRELPLDQFNKNRGSNDGLQDRCRECFSKYNRKRYAKNREAIVCHRALDAKRRVREGKTPYGVKGKRARPSAAEKIAQVLADE